MPELPEIETIKNGLKPILLNRTIISVLILRPMLRYPVDPLISDKVRGRKIISLSRRGKHLLINLTGNCSIIIHLGMSGFLQVHDVKRYLSQKHDHIILTLNNNIMLSFNDSRRFGYWLITNTDTLSEYYLFRNYGPEPFSPIFNSSYLRRCFSNKRQSIKSAIMSNNIVVGIGNIYACESLFLAGINPRRKSCDLTKTECTKIVNAIKKTLQSAIKQGGTTFKDYRDPSGKPGHFARSLKVYGRKGKTCLVCNNFILLDIISQRSTFYCPNCQRV